MAGTGPAVPSPPHSPPALTLLEVQPVPLCPSVHGEPARLCPLLVPGSRRPSGPATATLPRPRGLLQLLAGAGSGEGHPNIPGVLPGGTAHDLQVSWNGKGAGASHPRVPGQGMTLVSTHFGLQKSKPFISPRPQTKESFQWLRIVTVG